MRGGEREIAGTVIQFENEQPGGTIYFHLTSHLHDCLLSPHRGASCFLPTGFTGWSQLRPVVLRFQARASPQRTPSRGASGPAGGAVKAPKSRLGRGERPVPGPAAPGGRRGRPPKSEVGEQQAAASTGPAGIMGRRWVPPSRGGRACSSRRSGGARLRSLSRPRGGHREAPPHSCQFGALDWPGRAGQRRTAGKGSPEKFGRRGREGESEGRECLKLSWSREKKRNQLPFSESPCL